MKLFVLLAVIAAALGLYAMGKERGYSHPPGVLVKNPPSQMERKPETPAEIEIAGYKLFVVGEIELSGRVLATKTYAVGEAADIAPMDVVVGWGAMSDSRNVDKITLALAKRSYLADYESRDPPPIRREEIGRSSAILHLIPPNMEMRKTVMALRKGEIVRIKGYLVSVSAGPQRLWKTSQTRDDAGPGSGEIVYIQNIAVAR